MEDFKEFVYNADTMEDVVNFLSALNNRKLSSKYLTKFYAMARFNISEEEFGRKFSDGAHDGGIDFYHKIDNNFYIIQTKFMKRLRKKCNENDIKEEIKKMLFNILKEGKTKRSSWFINKIRNSQDVKLNIIFLTTGRITESVREEIISYIDEFEYKPKSVSEINFYPVDADVLENVLYDVKHGYIPYTGKKHLYIDKKYSFTVVDSITGIESIVGLVKVNDILAWIDSSYDTRVQSFLQKNVRGFLGSNKINRKIATSYNDNPEWFWYKHNGIIIFVDELEEQGTKIILYNPQIVNGGQTVRSIYERYGYSSNRGNSAKVLVRVYKLLVYSKKSSYKNSISIISALNSQSPIKPYDLRSTDTIQVRLEYLFSKWGFKYIRKREKGERASKTNILMTKLALLYYMVHKKAPDLGVRGEIDSLFESDMIYGWVFPKNKISEDYNRDGHIIINYIELWLIDYVVRGMKKYLKQNNHREIFKYARFYITYDIYDKVQKWKEKHGIKDIEKWIDFIRGGLMEDLIKSYYKIPLKIVVSISKGEEDKKNFLRTTKARNKFLEMAANDKTFYNKLNKYYKKFFE